LVAQNIALNGRKISKDVEQSEEKWKGDLCLDILHILCECCTANVEKLLLFPEV
jgi:hypothetical protein